MKKVNFCCFLGGIFLCDVMSNPLQNHERNISPGTVSHVNKLDEIKGSNYAPNFKEVGGAYCFWVVRPFVCPSVRSSHFLMHSITLKP